MTRAVVAAAGLIASPACFAGDLILVANKSVKAVDISENEIKSVFLGEKARLQDGSHVLPVTLKEGPAHEAILRVLGKTDAAFRTLWRKQVFTGKASMPRVFPSDAAMLAYIASTPDAIGYVQSGAASAGMNVLKLK